MLGRSWGVYVRQDRLPSGMGPCLSSHYRAGYTRLKAQLNYGKTKHYGTTYYREPGSNRKRVFRPGRDTAKGHEAAYRGGGGSGGGAGKSKSRCPICGMPLSKMELKQHMRTSHSKQLRDGGLDRSKYDRHGNLRKKDEPAPAKESRPKNKEISTAQRAIDAEERRQEEANNPAPVKKKKSKWRKFKSAMPFKLKDGWRK